MWLHKDLILEKVLILLRQVGKGHTGWPLQQYQHDLMRLKRQSRQSLTTRSFTVKYQNFLFLEWGNSTSPRLQPKVHQPVKVRYLCSINLFPYLSSSTNYCHIDMVIHFLQSPTDINYSNIQKLHYLESYIQSDIAAGN